MKQKHLLSKLLLLVAVFVMGAGTAWAGDTTVSYGWEDNDDATAWTITDAIAKTENQGNSGSYAGKINTNHTYVQFKEKVYVKSFSFAFKRTSTNNNYNVYIETSTDGNTWTAVETYKMSSFSNGSYTTKTKTFEGTEEYYVRFHCYNTTAVRYVDDVSITYSTPSSNPACAAPTFSPEAGTYTEAQNVTISTTTENATIYYTLDGSEPTAESTEYSGPIAVSETTTIKAIAVAGGYDNSSVATATYTIVSFEHAGTETDPYTVADARAAIDAGAGITGVYATGIVSEIVEEYNSSYSNITFDIIDAGGINTLRAYRCGGDEASDVQVGDVVVVSGDLTFYNSEIYEFKQGCQLVSLTHPTNTTPVITAADVELEHDATSGEIAYSVTNTVEGKTLSAVTTAEWISNITVNADNITFTTTANESAVNRTATITLSYEGATNVDVTVTQKHYVVDYAELPFEFNGGKGAIANTTGLTQNGLGSDYSSSNAPNTQLKFDSTDDWVVLKFNERPGTLSYNIKGNVNSGSFSGTFKVETSVDGIFFNDLKTYKDAIGDGTYNFDNLNENVRYIRWIFTEKDNGNVGLGNIKLEKYVAPSTEPSITVDPATVNVDAAEHEGTLALTYANLTISDMSDFGVQFYDAEGAELTTNPGWIEVLAAEQDPQVGEGYVVSYYMLENDGDARTAYCKVYALGDQDYVYSNLITITQAAYVAPGEWALTTLADLTTDDTFVIVGDNGDTYAMSNDNGSSAPEAVAISVASDNTLSGTIANNIMWKVSGNTTDGYTFYPSNSKTTWLYCTNANNGVRVGTGDAKHFTLSDNGYLTTTETTNQRYIGIYNSQDWRCYTSEGGNIASQTFSFYKNTAKKYVTITDAGYATYCSTSALDFSNTGVTAYKANVSNKQVSFTEVTQVPAGEGVLLKGAAGTYAIPVIASAEAIENALIGVTSETPNVPAGIFVLMNGDKGVGFYKTTTAFTVGANTAYLPASAGAARTFIGFDDTVTAIEGIAAEKMLNGEVYNLQGQRVVKAQKGLYIMNSKKVLVK